MALDYSPYFPPGGKNSYNQIPVVPSTNSASSTSSGVKYKTFTTNFDTITDTYPNPTLASERAYNIGCSGYRKILISSSGNYQYAPCSNYQDYVTIMTGMEKINFPRRYYTFDPRENVFDVKNSINDVVYNGYDYKEQIFAKTLSNIIFLDPKKIPILDRYQKVVFALIESVKQIRNYFNYTVPFNNRRVF